MKPSDGEEYWSISDFWAGPTRSCLGTMSAAHDQERLAGGTTGSSRTLLCGCDGASPCAVEDPMRRTSRSSSHGPSEAL
jgi:hypothetical protein